MNINEQTLEFQQGYYEGKIDGLKEAKNILTDKFTEEEKAMGVYDHLAADVPESEVSDEE